MRFLTLLCLCVLLLVNACTNLENNTEDQPITKNNTEEITPLVKDQEIPQPVIEEVVEKETAPVTENLPVKKKEPIPVIKEPKTIQKKTIIKEEPIEKVAVEIVEPKAEIVEPQIEPQIKIIEPKAEEIPIESENIVIAQDTSIDENIVGIGGFDENERASVDEVLNLLRKKFIEAEEEDEEDGILGFATEGTIDTSASVISEDSSSRSGITEKGGVATKTAVKRGAFDEVIETERTDQIFGERKPVDQKEIEFVRKPKILTQYYTGYKIELMTVYNKSLTLEDDLFKTFGGLTFVKEDNKTVYYLGDFKTKKALEDFLQKVVISRFPDAKGVKFAEGIAGKY